MTRVTYLDKAPYVKKENSFGERRYGDYINDHFEEYIAFDEFDVKYYI